MNLQQYLTGLMIQEDIGTKDGQFHSQRNVQSEMMQIGYLLGLQAVDYGIDPLRYIENQREAAVTSWMMTWPPEWTERVYGIASIDDS